MLEKKENEVLMRALRNGDMKTLRTIEPAVVRKDAGNYAYSRALNAEVVHFLIECGVKPVLGDRDETPFFHCRADKVESLVAAGYDVNQRALQQFGELPLIAATYANDIQKVINLLACGADVSLENQYGRKALFFAKTPEMRYILRVAEMKQKIEKTLHLHREKRLSTNEATQTFETPRPYKVMSFRCPLLSYSTYQNAG